MNEPGLKRIHVAGFRSLRDVSLDVGPINVLIGPNGAGKSNLLTALRVVSLMRTQSLRLFVGEQGGASRLLHLGASSTRELTFRLDFEGDQDAAFYDATLQHVGGDALAFVRETAGYRKPGEAAFTERALGVGHAESRLLDVAGDPAEVAVRAVSHLISQLGYFHFHDTSGTSPLRQNSRQAESDHLRSDGSNLASFLYRLRMSDAKGTKQSWNLISDLVRRVAPFIKELRPDLILPDKPEQSAVRLYWLDQRDHRFGVEDLSDGTLRAIALITALAQPSSSRPLFIAIDEPECGLHPAAITIVAGLVRSVSVQHRVLLATQSSPGGRGRGARKRAPARRVDTRAGVGQGGARGGSTLAADVAPKIPLAGGPLIADHPARGGRLAASGPHGGLVDAGDARKRDVRGGDAAVRIFLRGGPRAEIELLTGRDARHPAGVPIDFDSEHAALDFLSHFACDQRSMAMLRRVLVDDGLCSSPSSLGDHDVVRQLAWQLVRGRVRAVPAFARYGIASDAGAEEGSAASPPAPKPAREQSAAVHWIEIVLVDEEGFPVSGVDYELELPDGSVRRGVTSSAGGVRADGIPGGTCSFSYLELDTHVWVKTQRPASLEGRPPIHIARSWSTYDAVYSVRQGDSVESVAARAGHLWKTIWDHAQNADLRKQRKSGHVLYPGDPLFVPLREPRYESLPTDRVHAFKYKSIPSKLRIRFLHQGKPRRGAAYVLDVDGAVREGVLDGDGILEQPISPVAQRAAVRFKDKVASEEERMVRAALEARGHESDVKIAYEEACRIDLRYLDPTSTISGAQGRLRNYGFDIGDIDGELGPRTREALLGFQGEHGLEPTGELDDPTRRALHAITPD